MSGSQVAPPDDVDRIVAAWARQRPDLDVSPLMVFSRIWRLARRLDAARSAAFAGHGLESWEFDVLAALRRADGPGELSPSQLVRETMVTSGTMTNRVDRLLARGLVERRPAPNDRRGVLVRLTAAGQAAVDGAFGELVVRERELLQALPEQDRDQLVASLRALTRPLEP